MEVKILNDNKNSLDLEINNLTIAEILRVYLNKEGVKMAAWKREHPSKPAILHIEADNAKSSVKKAISSIQKDLEKYEKEFKSMK